ncbi:MAG TPA: hypothetical protein VHY10_10060 [Xanthobacteraceae bacterium]|jgi:hypothetical protein|nr:hypothetical protein [Xanthobacteraceae bacterium]
MSTRTGETAPPRPVAIGFPCALLYRLLPAAIALVLFLTFTALYLFGHQDTYRVILSDAGIDPWAFPFIDTGDRFAAWQCVRNGVSIYDIIEHNPCDVLLRPFNNSPFQISFSFIPLGVDAVGTVGCVLALAFILSLTLLPPARRPWELLLTVLAANSSTVGYAVERGNPDIFLFMLAMAAGFLALRRLPLRWLAYLLALFAAMLKYYPASLLILTMRERVIQFIAVNAVLLVLGGIFVISYFPDIQHSLALLPLRHYDGEQFGMRDLPHQTAAIILNRPLDREDASQTFDLIFFCTLAALLVAGAALCWRLLAATALPQAFWRLNGETRIFLVIGSVLIAGCFFSEPNNLYRGVYLLFVLPGLLTIARDSKDRRLRRIAFATGILVVLLMWGEFFRFNIWPLLHPAGALGLPAPTLKILFDIFLVFRELGWWWLVMIMLCILLIFLGRANALQDLRRIYTGRQLTLDANSDHS